MLLRKDSRGLSIQRKALIAVIEIGKMIYLASSLLLGLIGISISGNIALAIGVITYFLTQFILLSKN